MPSIFKTSKDLKHTTPKAQSLKEKVSGMVLPLKCMDLSSEDEDSDDDGVDEQGMARLMKALGNDGLDDFDRVQLELALSKEDESANEGSGDGGLGESESENELSEDDDEEEDEGKDEMEGELSEAGDVNEHPEGELENGEQEEEVNVGEVASDEVEYVDEDAVPQQKIEIDNKIALERILETIRLDPSLPWTETLVVIYPQKTDVDVNDDLNRELAFYKQALHGADTSRVLAAMHSFPFTRPVDYFAEMVKSDSHMERIRQRLLDETAGIKKSEDKRKERETKKFGKQLQIEKLKERGKSKKEMEERLKGLKRKRKDVLDKPNADDDFDVAVEDAISGPRAKRPKGAEGARGGLNRKVRDQRYGFGGTGRRSKQNTRESTDDFNSGSRDKKRGDRGGRGGGRGARGGGIKRLGKTRRMAARSKT